MRICRETHIFDLVCNLAKCKEISLVHFTYLALTFTFYFDLKPLKKKRNQNVTEIKLGVFVAVSEHVFTNNWQINLLRPA